MVFHAVSLLYLTYLAGSPEDLACFHNLRFLRINFRRSAFNHGALRWGLSCFDGILRSTAWKNDNFQASQTYPQTP